MEMKIKWMTLHGRSIEKRTNDENNSKLRYFKNEWSKNWITAAWRVYFSGVEHFLSSFSFSLVS